ncbi:unknown [Clostridium sp. CAG:356]|nr:MAG: hypothetical protein BHW02_05115 [Clostridium sp. 28_12]CDD36527.1 unknown [Clostridium sp. CAG:356]
MKKNKRINLIIIILVIIGIIFFVSKIVGNKNSKVQELAKVYNKLNSSQAYQFKWEQNDNNKTIIIKDGDKTLIDQYSKEEDSATQNHTKTLIKENSTYLILPDRKEYYIYEGNNVDQTFLIDGIKEIMGKEYTKGTEKVKGKKYKYEEYSGSTMFLLSNSLNLDENDVKTRFYFDSKDNLVYIKTIYGDKHELLKVSLTNDIDSSVFEIPADYAEN